MMLLLLVDASSKALPTKGHPVRDSSVQIGAREIFQDAKKPEPTFGSWRRPSTFHAPTFGDDPRDLIESKSEK